jgi:integrase
VSIGYQPTRDGKKLRQKDWYFPGTESEANDAAAAIANKWKFLVENWLKLYGTRLQIIGHPFADRPHWRDSVPGANPTDEEIEGDQNRPLSSEEIKEFYEDVKLKGVRSLYVEHLNQHVKDGEISKATHWTTDKNIRGVMKFFNEEMSIRDLTATVVKEARSKVLASVGKRTSSNYLGEFKRMLTWFYESDYGSHFDRPSSWSELFGVRQATRTDVDIPTVAQLKAILKNMKDEQLKLHTLLALNCGMYAVDIGRLLKSEINLDEGYIFWDREKQPENPFRVRHDLWPETLKLVKKHLAPTGELAFIQDSGKPWYYQRANGKATDMIGKKWFALMAQLRKREIDGHAFMKLRKITNQIISDLIDASLDDADAAIAHEISKTFLGEKTPQLERVYRIKGVNGFARMNRWLKKAGKVLRDAKAI